MSLVKTFTHLKDRPRSHEALPILQRVASLVKPIMRTHGPEVLNHAAESTFKDDPSLVGLNVNRGQKILLRLRPHSSLDSFYDDEQLVAVMLHELAHNVHGPHDNAFYKFLAGLETEYDVLKRSGYSGEAFHSVGRRLGQGASHNVAPTVARQKALLAAEQRRQRSELVSAPTRLGGRSIGGHKSPGQLAAEAAERRRQDDKACGQGIKAEEEAARAAESSVQDINVDLDDDLLETVPDKQKPVISTPATPVEVSRPISSPPHRSLPTSSPALETVGWACPTCTLINQPLSLQCEACLTVRPVSLNRSWVCLSCEEADNETQFWACKSCGTLKTQS